MPRKIEISHKTIIFTILVLLGLWFFYVIKDIILEFFMALLFMTILNPLVTKLTKYKFPRTVSVILIYLFLFIIIGFAISAIIPPLIEQTSSIVNNLPSYLSRLGISSFFSEQLLQQTISLLATLPQKVAKITVSIFSNLLSLVTILVFAFYLLSERNKLDSQLSSILGQSKGVEIIKFVDLLESKLGGWARGQLTLMIVVGTANYIGLSLLGIPSALPLAILAGLLEIVPYIGPIIAAIPAVILGFGISTFLGIATASLAFIIQQLENYVFVPGIMRKAAGVNPIITLFALAIGFRLAGVAGLLISVPVFMTLRLYFSEYLLPKLR